MVDTGVFLRWFVDQDGFEHAREVQQDLINGSMTVATVDFARVEVAGVLRKKGLLAGRLTPDEFAASVRVIDDIGVTVHETTRPTGASSFLVCQENARNVRRAIRASRARARTPTAD
jgi:predicted nucleic acid-binding protein